MATIKITVVTPDFLNTKKLTTAISGAVNKTVDAVGNDYKSSVKDFSPRSKPAWKKEQATVQGNKISGSWGTDDENYSRLNFGTSDHYVPKTGKRRMVFKSGYKKKTRRGRIPSVQGGPEGEVWGSYRHWIRGIDPRAYDETIAVANEQVLKRNIEQAIASLA